MRSFLRLTLLYLTLFIATQSIANTNAIGIRKTAEKVGQSEKTYHSARLKKMNW